MLADKVSDAGHPFYRLGAVHFLGAIPRLACAAFLADAFQRTGLSSTDDGILIIRPRR